VVRVELKWANVQNDHKCKSSSTAERTVSAMKVAPTAFKCDSICLSIFLWLTTTTTLAGLLRRSESISIVLSASAMVAEESAWKTLKLIKRWVSSRF